MYSVTYLLTYLPNGVESLQLNPLLLKKFPAFYGTRSFITALTYFTIFFFSHLSILFIQMLVVIVM